MTEPATIYREDEGEGVPMTPLRSLAAVLTDLAGELRRDMGGPSSGICDRLLCQDPPPELFGHLAALALWGEALTGQLRAADDCLSAGALPEATRHRDPLPSLRIPAQRIHQTIGHLADALRRWTAEAETQADALEEACRLVRCGQARRQDCGTVVTVVRCT